jgi:hypothetical protein
VKRRTALLVALGLALLVAAGTLLFPRVFKQVTEELPLPPTGEAAYNPLYALKLALLAHGQKVSSWPSLSAAEHALGAHDMLLLYDRPEAMSNAQAQRIVAWVRAGGRLLMPGPPDGASPGPLAGALGLRAVVPPQEQPGRKAAAANAGCLRVLAPGQAPGGERGAWLCQPPFLPTVPGFALAGGDDKHGYRFARRALGEGEVTVVELGYLDNDRLRDPAARALAFQLLAPGLGHGRIQLVYSADVPSLLRLLLTHAWMVLLPLALALAAWLAWRGQRFGPLQPAPEARRRALLEHVNASGEFTWGRQRASALHAAVLRLFEQRLRRRAPELDALAGEAQVLAIADATALPATRVRQALRPPTSPSPSPPSCR